MTFLKQFLKEIRYYLQHIRLIINIRTVPFIFPNPKHIEINCINFL